MSALSSIWLLIWKNFKLKLRHPMVSLMELGMPCLFSVILVIIRVIIKFENIPTATIYPAFSVVNPVAFNQDTLLYSPNTTQFAEVIETFHAIINDTSLSSKGFADEQSLVDYYTAVNGESIVGGVIFRQLSADNVRLKLRFPFVPPKDSDKFSFQKIQQFTWQTARQFPQFQEPGPRNHDVVEGGPPNYYKAGFLYLQHYLSRAIAITLSPRAETFIDTVRLNVQRFPYPPYVNDQFLFSLQFMFPLILMLSFIYPSVNLTKNIVLEKELRLQEAMRMMGLQDWLHWTSWLVNSFLWNLISVGLITTLLCVPLPIEEHASIITKSNPAIILLFFVVYLITTIMFCFMLSTFFSRANLAGVVFSAVYFSSFLPYFYVNQNYHELSFAVKVTLGIISNTNMAIGCMLISMWESEHVGLQWNNIFESASPDDTMTFGWVLIQFVASSILYFLVTFYVSNVFPGEFGLPKKWYFVVQPSYWTSSSRYIYKGKVAATRSQQAEEGNAARREGTSISDVSKTYNGGKTYALSKLDLQIENDEITVLLGHNGSGKTTLMSILCGLIPPTSGEIFIHGKNLMKDIAEIRKSLGICPQFDVLFDHLTVEEHLWFYCKLKHVDSKKIRNEIDQMIKLLDLKDKQHNQAYTLSGGMKRKLSIGIALVGGSKFVLLDECTSGMDVSARRFIWDLLLKEKRNRAILLSTHFMEEADVLGDKIAILDSGQLKAFGTPMHLKKTFGEGYFFRLSVKEELNFKLLSDLIRSYINGAKLITSVGAEVIYSLPEGESAKFEMLFKTIEQNMDKLGVIDYSISVTTIEEVFLRVGDFSAKGVDQFNSLKLDESSPEQTPDEKLILERIRPNSLVLNTGGAHFVQIYLSLLTKKLLFILRNKFLLISQFVLPAFLLWVSILTNRNQMSRAIDSPSLHLSFAPFKKIHSSAFHFGHQQEQQLSTLFMQNLRRLHTVDVKEQLLTNETEMIDALVAKGTANEAEYNLFYLTAVMFRKLGEALEVRVLFNNQAYHTSAISVAAVDEVLLQHATNNQHLRLAVYNEPLPRIQRDSAHAREFDSALQVSLSNNVQFSVCFLMASFVILLVKEKVTNFRHIQLISGLRLSQYWAANFALDYANYLVSCVLMSVVIYLSNVSAFLDLHNQLLLLFAFAMHGLASLPMNYLLSRFFADPATAYVRVALYSLIVGTTTFLLVLIMEIPEFDIRATSDLLDTVFSFILPIYTLSMCIFSLYQNFMSQGFCMADVNIGGKVMNVQDVCNLIISSNGENIFAACCKKVCGKNCFPFSENYLSWAKPGLGQYLLAFGCQAIFYWLFLAFVEWDVISVRWWRPFRGKVRPRTNIQGDDDVKAEEFRIKQRNSFTLNKSDSMIIQNVTKKYGNFLAVDNISFGVKRGECFGVLGINGSGKTTTFKMITGEENITQGDIIINGMSIKKNRTQVYQQIGYCPQFDGLLEQLTGRETLRIISRIRGIAEGLIDKQIEALAKLLFFERHINKPVSTYSGGTKRKLSFCLSILGNPAIIFLDEPTTGVDPVSRRCLWRAIQLVRSCGTSTVFTSHSMEECEVLCNRLIIMLNSRLACLGSPLHLKQKYGAGYIVHIKLCAPAADVPLEAKKKVLLAKFTKLNNFMTVKLPDCRLETIHNNLLTYRVETSDVKLSTLFGEIEGVKVELDIEDYSIYQTSLERIFLSFARQASE